MSSSISAEVKRRESSISRSPCWCTDARIEPYLLAMQIDRCDQLTNYLSKFQAPSSASTAASNGPSSEVASIDGYKVGKLLCHPPQQCCCR